MEESKNTAAYSGISFVGILTIVFVVLKLTHVVDWSWWWVVSPVWIGVTLTLILLAIVILAIELFNIFT